MKHDLKETLNQWGFALYNLFAKKVPENFPVPDDPFEALNARFDAVWVLTIPRFADRQEFIRTSYPKLKFEFFFGVDGKTIVEGDHRIDKAKSVRDMGRELRTNEYANSLSHCEIYKKFLASDLETLLVFEDDADFDAKKAKWVARVLRTLPADWEYFYLGHRNGELRGIFVEFFQRFGLFKEPGQILTKGVSKGIRTAARHDHTHAYAVTRSGARTILEANTPAWHTADGLMANLIRDGKIRAYSATPKWFFQHLFSKG